MVSIDTLRKEIRIEVSKITEAKKKIISKKKKLKKLLNKREKLGSPSWTKMATIDIEVDFGNKFGAKPKLEKMTFSYNNTVKSFTDFNKFRKEIEDRSKYDFNYVKVNIKKYNKIVMSYQDNFYTGPFYMSKAKFYNTYRWRENGVSGIKSSYLTGALFYYGMAKSTNIAINGTDPY